MKIPQSYRSADVLKRIKGQKRLQASSLVEVLITLVLIMGVFVAAIAVFTRITTSGISQRRLVARQQMKGLLYEFSARGEYLAGTFERDSFIIRSSVEDFPGYDDVLVVKLFIYDQEKELDSLKKLVRKERDNYEE